MSYPINYPTPQGANVQIFQQGGTTTDWVKPQGASFVWFTLIGGGADGSGASATSSGAVTNFMCPAFLIPDVLRISVGNSTLLTSTTVIYQQKDGTGYTLLSAATGIATGGAAAAMTANAFTAAGFFQSIAGVTGTGIPTTTFLTAGTGAANTMTSQYGYKAEPTPNNGPGFFQLQPIIVGVGGIGTGNGGVGCGGGVASGSLGGDGLAVIITW